MSISSRIHDTVENWQVEWKDRLRGWMASWLSFGIELFMDILGKGLATRLNEIIDTLAAEQAIPAEIVAKMKDLWKPGGEWQAVLGYTAGGTAVGSLIGSTIGAWLKLLEYETLKIARSFRLDPGSVITAWRRDPAKYETFFDDLREQGWSDERIETLKFITLFLPSASDIVSWYAREVYEPEMITRYGLDSELPNYAETDFPKIGVDAEQARNYWRAHWVHASWMQVVEMLRRGQLKEDEVRDWFRLVEIPPFWRDKLIAISYAVPTRVDVRRWWDMRTITEERLREVYAWQGYHGKDLDDYVLWTKVYVAFPDLIARFKNGWITEDDVRSELEALGMPHERINEMIQTKIKSAAPERVAAEKTATATEIMKAVKKGLITWSEGIERLARMGYSNEEADFKLKVYVGVAEGSPETYMEFVDLTERYRQAMGLEANIPPAELIEAGKALREAEVALKTAKEEGIKEAKLAPYEKAVSDAAYRYRQMLVKWREEKKAQ